MSDIIIENLTERHLQYRVDHQAVCVKAGKCFCRRGRRSNVAASIHVPGGKGRKTFPVPSEVAMIPQLRADANEPNQKIKIHGAKVDEKEAKKKAKAAIERRTAQENLAQEGNQAKAKSKAEAGPAKSKKGKGGQS